MHRLFTTTLRVTRNQCKSSIVFRTPRVFSSPLTPTSLSNHSYRAASNNFKASGMSSTLNISYLNQVDAQQVDVDLMSSLKFSIDQLMELAGLSVASALADAYPLSSHPRVLVVCGPGSKYGFWGFGLLLDVVLPPSSFCFPVSPSTSCSHSIALMPM